MVLELPQTLTEVVRHEWERAIEEQDTVVVRDVVERVRTRYPDLVDTESDRLVDAAIAREIKAIARGEAEHGAQLSLFGFPSVIAIPIPEDGYEYMATAKARWEQLVSGGDIRQQNVLRAQQRLDQYNSALDYVRPVMQGTDKTLDAALAELDPTA